ncbi:MAG: hypothetical protein OXH06_19240 [Gemmatimonadetes bacterium]|nr:hypothetical protein [Gemmatimonadota bacterium]
MRTVFMLFCAIQVFGGTINAQHADPHAFQQRGFVNNGIGEKCWFSQQYFKHKPYFLVESLKDIQGQELRVVTFDNPKCMRDNLAGFDTDVSRMLNLRMINLRISSWYVETYVIKDTRFDVDNLRPNGKYEARGKCIQSEAYPSKGIAVDYVTSGQSITHVHHAMALGGCGSAK